MTRRGCTIVTLWFVSFLFVGCSAGRQAGRSITFRVMTYNIHHGEGVDSTVDLRRIAAVIKEAGADIVALQEVDRGVERTNKIDIMTELSDLTGMAYAFGKNIDYQGGDYGNGILTKFPILEEHNHHYAMIRPGEQRGLLILTLEISGREILLMNTHIDYRPDDTERLMNAEEILAAAQRHSPKPAILCGDLNDTPESRTIARLGAQFLDTWTLGGTGQSLTYPSVEPKKRIDFVFVSMHADSPLQPEADEPSAQKAPARPVRSSNAGGDTPVAQTASLRVRSARVVQSEASDHLPVVVEFELSREQ